MPLPYRIFILVFGVVVLLGCTRDAEENQSGNGIVATVGSFEISDTHFTNYLKRFYLRTGQAVNLNEDVRLGVINGRIERYAIVEFARDQGWASDADAQYNKSIIERKVMMEAYERHFIHDRVQITEADLRDVFLRYNTRLRASHLRATNRYAARELHNRLMDGASFEDLAKEIFKNPSLASSGGDLGFFSIDEMDLAFEDQAYAMNVGEISQPVRTSTGFSIIKLTDRVTNPILTETMFAQRKQALQQVAHRQRTEMATRNDIAAFVEESNWNRQAIRALWESINENLDVYKTTYFSLNEIPFEFDDEFRAQSLVRGAGFNFTVADFLAEAYFTPAERRAQVSDFYQFEEQVEGMAYRYRALGLINKLPGLDTDFIAGSIEETFYSYLLSRFDSHVQASVQVSETEVYETFQADPSMFESPLKLNMAEIVVTDPEIAQSVVDQLERGLPFTTALRRYGAQVASYGDNGEIGFRAIQEFGTMAPVLQDIKPGEFAGPFQITDRYFVILQCIGRTDPRPLSFEEAEESIREYLKFTKQQRERVRMVEELRRTYNADINLARLNTLSFEL
ncbi:MAG: peptidylprolyl isomerase [Bacteroidetes bacterium]|nr:peptidylprolyl isomerase [Bacteroidota bacterium]MCH8524306.1 peptidylprolyl isomerase [Balneolales bacterium]